MPKMKTNKGAAKRFKLTKSGKVRHRSAFRNHILTKKSKARKRNLRKNDILSPADTKSVRRLLCVE